MIDSYLLAVALDKEETEILKISAGEPIVTTRDKKLIPPFFMAIGRKSLAGLSYNCVASPVVRFNCQIAKFGSSGRS
ncbi:MAG: hypothetical protein ACI82A_002503 [Candidatus Azotimanducaceae bacterium]